MLIIVAGLQGTGKSTVAKKLAKKINAILISTDAIRKKLFTKQKYNKKSINKVYDVMFLKAKRLLQINKNVILDATFYNKKYRKKAKIIANKFKTKFVIVEVICPEAIIKKRIEKRYKDKSEANFYVYLKYKKLFEKIIEPHIILHNLKDIKYIENQLDHYF